MQRLIYFIRKVLQGAEVQYLAIKKMALAVVFTARRLRHYFQSFTVIVMTDLAIWMVLQKPDIAGRMVRWAIELSKFDIHYEPQAPIKGQVCADFMIELSLKDFEPNEVIPTQMKSNGSSLLMGPPTCKGVELGSFLRTKWSFDRAGSQVYV